VRYIDETQKQFAKEKMRSIISAKIAGVKSDIQFVDGIPPMAPTQNNLKLLQQYSQVSLDLNQGKVVALEPGVRGAGDISYVADIVPASLSGLGPVGNGTHTVIESAELASFVIQTQRAAILILRLANAHVA
jgi:glutamate carboxypeptidase